MSSERGGGGVTLRPAGAGDRDTVLALQVEYLTWATGRLREVYGVAQSPTDLATLGSSLAAFAPPDGLVLLADGPDGPDGPVGTAALRRLEPGVVEVKRMYVVPDARGGLGGALLDELLVRARTDLAAATVRLDTCGFMTAAQGLYRSRGFTERPPYPGTEIPPPLQHLWRFYEKQLG